MYLFTGRRKQEIGSLIYLSLVAATTTRSAVNTPTGAPSATTGMVAMVIQTMMTFLLRIIITYLRDILIALPCLNQHAWIPNSGMIGTYRMYHCTYKVTDDLRSRMIERDYEVVCI